MSPRYSSMPHWRHAALLGSALAVIVLLAGCGGDHVETYPLTGAITYQGEPIPRGYIVFEPKADAGNSGPGTQAEILDGRYTMLKGLGVIGGPHTVHVYGYDGQPVEIPSGPDGQTMTSTMGRPLFTGYSFDLDLPREASEHDIEVPAQ